MQTLLFQESPFMVLVTILLFSVFTWWRRECRMQIVFVFCLVMTCLCYFYRVPDRYCLQDDDAVMAASDGVVMSVERDDHAGTFRVSVFLSILDQHLQFYPISGKVVEKAHRKGSFHPAYIMEKSRYNEKMETTIRTPRHGDVIITQIAGQIARRIVNHAEEGCEVQQGDYLGMIKLSSRVDVEFSSKYFYPCIKKGDQIFAKKTIIAKTKSSTEHASKVADRFLVRDGILPYCMLRDVPVQDD